MWTCFAFGNSTGSIDLTVTGGTSPYTYNWGGGVTTQDRTNLAAGTYTVTVTDANSCTATKSVTITEPPVLSLSETNVDVLCNGNSTGSIDLTVTGGTSPYTYSWTGGATTQDRTNLAAGTYTVTVTDANACTKTLSATITEPSVLSLSTTKTDATCGNSNGSIDLTVTGGTSPYTYNWGGGITTQDRTNLAAGTYTVTVTDANSCTKTVSATVNNIGGPSLSETHVNVLCFGNSTGSIDISVSGGTSPYTYNWGGGVTTQDRTNLAAGTYTVTVTDANSCTATKSVTITEPPVLSLSETNVDVLCYGNSTGSIDLTVTGGTSPYTYSWTGGATTQDRTNLAAGTYTVTVTDANACTKTISATITEPSALSLSTTKTDATCGNSNGSIDLTVTGGTSPYTYNWGGGITTQDRTNLAAGTYTVTVTDANSCTKTVSATVNNIGGPSLSETHVNVLCFGNSTGSIDLTVTGGTSPYTYSWTGGVTTQDRTNLAAGTYTVTVTDANSCTATKSVTITEPPVLSLSETNVDVLCNGNSTGSIDLTVTGGTSPYTYNWGGGVTTQDRSSLAAGTYTVTVTDANSCTKTISATITQPAVLSLSETNVDVLCNGNSTGSIDLTVTGGTSPYTYSWTGGVTTQDRTNLAAGTYTVTVTDANSCTKTLSATITEPTNGLSLSVTTTNSTCGNANGAIDLTATGGTSPYTYNWGGGVTTEDRSNISAGTYTVTVTDANGCTKTITATVNNIGGPVLDMTITNVSCFGGNNGAIDLTVTGGTSPYTYAWTNGATTQDLSNLAAGTYTATVTDANGCSAVRSGTVQQPAELTLSTTQVNLLCYGTSSGSIDLSVSGGTSPYTYLWAGGATTQDRTGLMAGTYTVTVTDANNCTKSISATITQPTDIEPVFLTTHVTCYGGNNGAIDMSVSGGTPGYTYLWTNGSTMQDLSGLTAGTYTVTITDANSCTKAVGIIVVQPSEIMVSETHVNVLCNGASTGSIDLTASGGTGVLTYDWSHIGGSSNPQDPTGLAAGTYTVTVTDANNCSKTLSVTITQPPAIVLTKVVTHVLCYGGNNGAIDLTVSGGVSPYTYAWSNSATTQDISNLAAGTYTVTVTDANGCTKTTSATVNEPSDPLALSETNVDVLCYGNSTGSIDLTVSGGTPAYSYNWGGGITTQDRSNLAAGTYTVTVTDANGCTKTISATITQPPSALTASATTTNSTCGNPNGSVDLTVSGGTSPYTYAWSNGATTQDLSNVMAGTYTVTVTDANGCTKTTSATVNNTGGPSLSETHVNVLCFGNSTGSIDLTVTGGTSPYTYAWTGGATTQDRTNLAAGTYCVTVTDASACTAVLCVTITQPAEILLTETHVNLLCYGTSTGSIDLTVSGGTSPYSYNWGGGVTTQDRTGLSAGTYTVTVTDANSCTKTLSATITTPPDIEPIFLTTHVTCYGGNNGAIDMSVSGGTPGYTYLWSNGSTTQDLANLTAGTYTVTVTDANSCTKAVGIIVIQPPVITLTETHVNVLCNGASTGSIDLTASGGTGVLTYDWSHIGGNNNPQDPTGLAAGTYTVTVTDANNCTKTLSATITEPPALVLTTVVTHILCYGGSTGAIDLTVSGGVSPYTYAWTGGATTQDISNLAAGTYTVTVTDANGCTKITSATVNGPSDPIVLSETNVDVLCYGNSTGSIDLTVSGGTPAYTYAWSNSATTQDLSNLAAGTYTVTVTDANGCTKTISATITQPPSALTASATTTNSTCGNPNGSVDLTVSGGTSPYTYAWSNGATTQDLSNVMAGTYTVTVTDANGCTKTTSATVNNTGGPSLGETHVNVLCFGNSTGSIDLTVTGGTSPYTYAWTGGATTQDRSNLAAGTYCVTVTDASACTAVLCVTITQPAEILLTETHVNLLCYGTSTGSIDLTVSGGTSPYSYNWGGGVTTQDRTGLSAGTYTVTVTDANSCTKTLSATITTPPDIEPIFLTTHVTCYGGNNGAIDMSVSGGTPGYTYLWSNGSTTQDLANLTAGTYTVTVTDANSCTKAVGIIVIQPPVITLTETHVNVLCNGASTGSIDLTASGGTGVLTYDWSHIGGNNNPQDPTGLAAGTYCVTVTDANGCTKTLCATISEPPAMVVSTTVTNVSCFGGANGAVDLTVSGGTPGYTYVWTTGATTQDISGLVAGTYTATVTDANGCTKTTSATVTEPPVLALSTTVVNVLCNGNATGSIDLSVSGGTPGYTYAWSNGATIQDPFNLAAGTYTVTVTDAKGCTKTTSATVTQPPALMLTTTVTNVNCNGASTGSIDLTVNGGVSPYTYAWTNGATTQDISGLTAGTYTVTVTDANGCTKTTSATVTENSTLAASATATPVSCFGGSNGTIDLTVSGGVSPYTYVWTNGATTQDISGLTAGTYTVTVTDNVGCTKTASATVSQPPVLALSTVVTNVSCFGGNNGAINLTVSGGTPGYTYVWSNNATTQDISGLVAGTYTVTVMDANGCTKTTSATVTEPPVLALNTSVTNVLCNSAATGAIDLTVSGGTPGYTYLWSNNATTQDISGLVAGTYTVTVTDANGCTKTTSATVTQPPAIALSSVVSNVLCNGASTGAIDLTVSGGVAPYSYAWTNGATTQDISGLVAGTYTVTVTDANGCTKTTSATVTQPPALALSTTITNVLCNGASTGAVDLTVSGGTPGYTYTWTNGATTQDISGLVAGTYTVTVTDANGCTKTTSATVTEPPALALSTTVTNVLCNGASTGAVDLTVSGGVAPYSYIWTNGATTQDISNLAAGTYTVTVTDANGCTKTTSATVTQPPALSLSTSVTNILCNGGATGAIDLSVSGGVSPYSYAWTNGASTQDISGLTAGTYTVTVTDANGCTKTTSATVTENGNLMVSATSTPVSCFGGSNGTVDLTVSGGVSPYTYAWTNGATTQDLSGLTAGTYTVTVTDNVGCSKTTSVTVTQPPVLALSTVVTNLLCYGVPTGAVDLTVSGGTPGFTYVWSNGAVTQDLANLFAGTYTVTVTDANGCTKTTSATVTQPSDIAPVFLTTHVTCFGGNNGAIDMSVSGGTPGYTYLWSNGATTQDLMNLTAGTYTVTVTDANSCTKAVGIIVVQPSEIIVSETHVNVLCNGASTGSIDLTASGGTGALSYDWSHIAGNNNPQDPTGLAAGTYCVTVTDANGCTKSLCATITEPPALQLSAIATNASCTGLADGSIDLTVSGGTPGYTYLWSNGATTQDPSGLVAGTYTVTVTDANGCTKTTSATVLEPTILVVSAVPSLCDPLTNLYSLEVTVSWTNAPTTSITVTTTEGGMSIINIALGSSGTQTTTITGLTSNGVQDIDVKAAFNATCFHIFMDAYDAPLECNSAEIGDYVWEDLDIDGIQDGNESGIPNVSVNLTGTDQLGNPVNLNTTTDGTGHYLFDDLVPGTYKITFGSPGASYELSPQDQGANDAEDSDAAPGTLMTIFTVLSPGESDMTWDAGFYQPNPDIDIEKYVNGEDADTAPGVIILVPNTPPNVTFTFTTTNTGNMTLNDVEITDDIYGFICSIPTLAPGASHTCTITVPAMRGLHTNLATVTGQPVLPNDTPFGPPVDDEDPANYTGVFINMDKMANKTEVCAGEEVTYTLITRMLGGTDGIELRNIMATDNNVPGTFVCNDQYWVTCAQNGGILCDLDGDCILDFTDPDNNGVTNEEFKWSYTLTINQTTVNVAEDMAEVWYVDPITGDEFFVGNVGNMDEVTVTVNPDRCAEIGNYVWEDSDADGIQDGNEVGIPNVPVTLTGIDVDGNPVNENTTTDASGLYLFSGLVPGDYQVTFGTPAGGYMLSPQDQGGNEDLDSDAAPGTQQTIVTTLIAGESDLTWDAGFFRKAEIGNYVWEDTDGDGIQDGNEPGIPNVPVTLTGTDGFGNPVNENTTTDGNGFYEFTDLVPGTYKLTFGQPAGYQVTAQDQGGNNDLDSDIDPVMLMTVTTVLESGESDQSWDAGFNRPAEIGDFVWYDLDKDGVQDGNEVGIPNLTVTLTGTDGAGNPVNESTTTDANGFYLFDGLTPGTYKITFTSPGAGYIPSPQDQGGNDLTDSDGNPGTLMTINTVLESGESDLSWDQGFYQDIDLTTFVVNVSCYEGMNGAIDLTVNGGTAPFTFLWSNGATTEDLTNLSAGTYTVTVTDANGFTATSSTTITQPPALLLTPITVDVQCNGGSDGDIDLTVTGGTAPYTYAWSNGATTQDLTNVPAGTYTVTVTDGHDCSMTASATIDEPDPLVPTAQASPVSCFGGSDGDVDLTVSGGTAPYTYAWSNGATTQDLTNVIAGTYTVIVTDSHGCTATASATVTQPPVLELDTDVTNVSCNGGNTGAIDLLVTGGTTPYTYAWSNGATTQDISGLAAGTYCVTVTDAHGCTKSICATIEEASELTASAQVTNILCNGLSSGAIDVTVNGGTPGYTYLWNPGGMTTEDLSNISADTYCVTVTDVNGCTVSLCRTVTQPPALLVTSTEIAVLCNGGSDGSINLSVSGGVPGYTYLWSNGLTTQDLEDLPAGNYCVTVTDANGCSKVLCTTITQPPVISLDDEVTNVSCFGGDNGAINLFVVGGSPNYTYLWDNGATTQDLSNVEAGTYCVTVTDSHGCEAFTCVNVGQPTDLVLTTDITDVACNGGATGAVNLSVSGGTPGYTYDWSNIPGANNPQDISNLTAGTYTVTVTDSQGCTKVIEAVVDESSTLEATFEVTNVLCNGGSDGDIDITVSGGTPGYTYLWSYQGRTTEDLINVPAGAYSVTITDAAGCQKIVTATIGQPTALNLSATVANVNCNNGSDGAINLTVSGGTPDYTYVWSNGETTQDINGLTAGTYTVTVTDDNGCTASLIRTVGEPTPLAPSVLVTDVLCFGGNNGSVNLSISGGTPGYTYLWSNGATTQDINNLIAGDYCVTISDAHGCTATICATVDQPTALELDADITTVIGCTGGNNGAIDLSVTGGTPAYSYAWSTGATTQDISGLAAGTYTVTVTDANGCKKIQAFVVGQFGDLMLDIDSTNPICAGTNSGTIDLTITGGLAPYQIDWSNIPGANNPEDQSNLPAGIYSVTVTDENGCTAVASVTLIDPVINLTAVPSPVSCFGGNNGSINLTATGGNGGFSYNWSNGFQGEDPTGLIAGTYTVTVTDANNCTKTISATVTQPTAITFSSIVTHVSCNGGNNGAINITVNGGTPAYTYLWAPGGQTTQDLNGLTAGTYTVTITDANGCTKTGSFTVNQPTQLSVTITQVTNSCFGVNTGDINISVSGGTPAYSYLWSNGATTQNLLNVAPGTYCVTVTDANGCTRSACATIQQNPEIILSATVTNVSCNGGNNGSINLTVSGGTPAYTYNWSNGATTQDLNNLHGRNLHGHRYGCHWLHSYACSGCYATTSPRAVYHFDQCELLRWQQRRGEPDCSGWYCTILVQLGTHCWLERSGRPFGSHSRHLLCYCNGCKRLYEVYLRNGFAANATQSVYNVGHHL